MKHLKLVFTALVLFASLQADATISRLLEVDHNVWRGSQPQDDNDYQKLKQMGIKTIINLRWDKSVAESKEMAEKYNINFINIPWNAKDRPKDADIEKIFSILQDSASQPVYLHCTFGKDRTGLIFALYRVKVQGWSPAKAYAEWLKFGFAQKFLPNLDQYFKEKTAYNPQDEEPLSLERKVQAPSCNKVLQGA